MNSDIWHRHIANHRLHAGLLHTPDASERDLIEFAGTMDGYAVRPKDIPTWVVEVLERFEAGEPIELGLTMSRTALFAFQRWRHMTDYGGMSSSWKRCMHALVERIRLLVVARDAGGGVLDLDPVSRVEDGLMDAYERFLEGYAGWGGHAFHGWTDYPDTQNFQGPMVWSEADCAFRFALELERSFPRSVHAEFAIGKATRLDYAPDVERRQRVDLVVSDFSTFVEDEQSQDRFRTWPHDAFIETKWLVKGWAGNRFELDAHKRGASVHADIKKLDRHLELDRCSVAAVLVVDDEDFFLMAGDPEPHDTPSSVWRLVAGPRALRQRGLLREE